MNLLRIRYNDKLIHPKEFRNKGLRGWWIRVLNSIRFRIEQKVVYHVMCLMSDEDTKLQIENGDVAYRESIIDKRTRYPSSGASLQAHRHEVKQVEPPSVQTARMLERYAAEKRSQSYAFSRNHRVIMEADQGEETNGEDSRASEGISVSEENSGSRGQRTNGSATSVAITARRAESNDEALGTVNADD